MQYIYYNIDKSFNGFYGCIINLYVLSQTSLILTDRTPSTHLLIGTCNLQVVSTANLPTLYSMALPSFDKESAHTKLVTNYTCAMNWNILPP